MAPGRSLFASDVYLEEIRKPVLRQKNPSLNRTGRTQSSLLCAARVASMVEEPRKRHPVIHFQLAPILSVGSPEEAYCFAISPFSYHNALSEVALIVRAPDLDLTVEVAGSYSVADVAGTKVLGVD
jgi:hypothetical protein